MQITIRHLLTMTSGLDDRNSADVAPYNLHHLANAELGGHITMYLFIPCLPMQWMSLGKPISKPNERSHWDGRELEHGRISSHIHKLTRSMARFGLLALNKGKWEDTPMLMKHTFQNQPNLRKN